MTWHNELIKITNHTKNIQNISLLDAFTIDFLSWMWQESFQLRFNTRAVQIADCPCQVDCSLWHPCWPSWWVLPLYPFPFNEQSDRKLLLSMCPSTHQHTSPASFTRGLVSFFPPLGHAIPIIHHRQLVNHPHTVTFSFQFKCLLDTLSGADAYQHVCPLQREICSSRTDSLGKMQDFSDKSESRVIFVSYYLIFVIV